MVQSIFRYLEPFIGMTHESDRQMDGQTDRHFVANTVLHYVAPLKTRVHTLAIIIKGQSIHYRPNIL